MCLTELAHQNELFFYIARACTTPLGIPAMLILVDQWRVSFRTVLRVTVCLYLLLLTGYFSLYFFVGITKLTLNLVAWGTPLICWAVFIAACRFRDGRLLFSAVTALLLAFVSEAMACMLAVYGSPLWFIFKVVLTLIELMLLGGFGRKPFLRMLHTVDTGWVRLSLMPLFLLACLLSSYLLPMFWYGVYANPFPTLILCVTILLIYNSLYRLVMNITAQNEMKRDMGLLNNQVHLMERQAQIIQTADHDHRLFRHNLRHFVGMLQGCADAGDFESVQGILSSMEASFETLQRHYSLRCYTGQPVLDAVLSLAEEQAGAAGVRFTAQIILPEPLPVDSVQLAVVLSNALENALIACSKLPLEAEKEIRVSGEVLPQQFYLSIRNSFDGRAQFDPITGFPVTEETGHGYGTQTLTAFAAEYGAIIDFHTEGNWFCFGMLM